MLTQAAFARAVSFLKAYARPLEIARYGYHFEAEAPETVTAALAAFQRPEGGFGGALEPDLRSPSVSPFVTSVGFQVLFELSDPFANPLATQALGYLHESFSSEVGAWPVTPKDADDFPHAFWWSSDQGPEKGRLNPGAELLGVLIRSGERTPAPILTRAQAALEEALEEKESELEMHEWFCVQRLRQAPALAPALAELCDRALEASLPALLGKTPAAWAEYGMTPMQAFPTPESPCAKDQDHLVGQYLAHLVETQLADGSWEIPWDWSAAYPSAYAKAKVEWKGIRILETLCFAKAWGQLEGAN